MTTTSQPCSFTPCLPVARRAGTRARARALPRTVCVSTGLGVGSDEPWGRTPSTRRSDAQSTNATASSGASDGGASDGQVRKNFKVLDGGLPRNEPLPLSLLHRLERLPAEDKVRLWSAVQRAVRCSPVRCAWGVQRCAVQLTLCVADALLPPPALQNRRRGRHELQAGHAGASVGETVRSVRR